MNTSKAPSKKGYALAGGILAIGIILCVVLLSLSLSSDNLDEQVVVPGFKELTFDKEGTYTIFYEYRSVVDGKVYQTDQSISGLQVLLEDKATNNPVELKNSTSSTFNVNGREGVSVFTFDIDEPGTYVLSAWYDGSQDTEVVLSVKEGFVQNLLFIVFGVISAGGLGFIAVVIFIWTYYKRAKYNRAKEGV